MAFQGFVCWEPGDVNRIAPIDVGSIVHDEAGDASIFLATHQPLQLIKTSSNGAATGEMVGEDLLLSAFRSDIGNDPDITVITGAVGTGKSHMVKWLHAQCASRADWHQVYIEKRNTNLRRVIETILAGLNGPKVAELREQLQVASSAIRDIDEAKSNVISKLAHQMTFPSRGASADGNEYERGARAELPNLLNDPVLRAHLLREGGAIHRITKLGLEGLPNDDDERDLFFRLEDLPLQPADLLDASALGQTAVRRLAQSERLRSAAIEVLNEELAAAKAAVFIGSGVDLIGLFDEVRRELGQRGLDLVLYIEDLVLLHGIDRELTQVFTEGRGPSRERCGMRVAIAVTEGYLASGFDTLTSRADHYSLNLNLGDHVSAAVARSFVGRYLNAIRVGAPGLSDALARSEPGTEWVPNRCETCQFQEPCHEAFGTDEQNHGLYPLNPFAVERLVRLAGTSSTVVDRFDPREVLRAAVRDPLALAADELPLGRFPSGRFAAVIDPNRRSVAVAVRDLLSDIPDGERYLSLLAYWAPGQPPIDSVVNLDSVIHKAFALPEYAGAAIVGPVDPPGPGPKRPPPPAASTSVDAWANRERQLPSSDARLIRRWVVNSVLEQATAAGLPVRSSGGRASVGGIPVTLETVRIEDAQGGGVEVARAFAINLGRSPANAVLMKAILTAEREGRWRADDVRSHARLVALVDGWVQDLIKAVRKRTVDLEPAVRVLAAASPPMKGGIAGPGDLLEHSLGVTFDSAGRTSALKAWNKSAATAQREALVVLAEALGGAKGSGAVSFLDGAAVAQPLRKAVAGAPLGETLKGSERMVEVQRRLRDDQRQVEVALGNECARLAERMAADLGTTDSWDAMRGSVAEAISRAHQQGVLPIADAIERLDALASEVPEDALTTLRRLGRANSGDMLSIWSLLPDPVPRLEALDRYRTAVDSVFTALEQKLDGDLKQQHQKVGPGATAIAFRALADLLDGVLGGGQP